MGQKVSPIGLRIGVNKGWESNWYAEGKDFGKYLYEDYQIRQYLEKKLKDAAVSKILIQRTGKNNSKVEITINTAKPGVVIGHGGDEITKLRKDLAKHLKMNENNLHISIKEIKNPNLDAALVAENIAHQIENRVAFRVAQKKVIRNVMRSGAKGIKTLVSGRLNGVEIARSEGYTEGTIPLHTLRANVDYASKEANTTYGKIGVKVWIYKGEILPKKKQEKVEGGNNDGSNSKKN